MEDMKAGFLALFSREFQNEKFSFRSSANGSPKLSTKTLLFWARWFLDNNGDTIEGGLHLYAKKIQMQPAAARTAVDELASIGLVTKRCSAFGSGQDKIFYEVDRNELYDWADSTPEHVINFLRDLLSTSPRLSGESGASNNERRELLGRIKSLSITKKVLLSVMFVNSDRSGYVLGLSLKGLGAVCGIPYRSIQTYLAEFAVSGIIHRHPGVSGCGVLGRMSSIYRLNFSVLDLESMVITRDLIEFSSFPSKNDVIEKAKCRTLGRDLFVKAQLDISHDSTLGRLREMSSHVFQSAFSSCKSPGQLALFEEHFFRYQVLIIALSSRLLNERDEFCQGNELYYDNLFELVKFLMSDLSKIIPDISSELIEQHLPLNIEIPSAIPVVPRSLSMQELISRFRELWSEDQGVIELLPGCAFSIDHVIESLKPLYKASMSITIALHAIHIAALISQRMKSKEGNEYNSNATSDAPWTIYLSDEHTLNIAMYLKPLDKDKQ